MFWKGNPQAEIENNINNIANPPCARAISEHSLPPSPTPTPKLPLKPRLPCPSGQKWKFQHSSPKAQPRSRKKCARSSPFTSHWQISSIPYSPSAPASWPRNSSTSPRAIKRATSWPFPKGLKKQTQDQKCQRENLTPFRWDPPRKLRPVWLVGRPIVCRLKKRETKW